MMKHSKVASGADDPAAEVKFSDWNADHVIDADGAGMVTSTATPATPAAGKLSLVGRNMAGQGLAGVIDEYGLMREFQPHLGRKKVAFAWPTGGTTTLNCFGMPTIGSLSGTTTSRPVNPVNLVSSLRRIGIVSAATAGSVARLWQGGVTQFWRGNVAGGGGFHLSIRFCCSDAATVAGARTFIGIGSGLGNADPSSLTNIIGIGTDGGDDNFSIFHNDGAGTATKIPLGADFPDHTLSADAYELALYCPPNASWVGYRVERLNRPDIAPKSGIITTDLPPSGNTMGLNLCRNNNATALAVGLDLIGIYLETEL